MPNYQPRPLRPDRLTVVGLRPYDMKNEDGRRVQGVTIYFTCEDPNDNVNGLMAGKISVSQSVLDFASVAPALGLTLDIRYDGNGKIKDVLQAF